MQMNRITRRSLWGVNSTAWAGCLILAIALSGASCGKREAARKGLRLGKPVYDAQAIDLTKFPGDPAVLSHILYMPFGEAATRLASLKFVARSSFVFSRGTEEYEQDDVYEVVQDSLGNFHVSLDTPDSQIEVYLIGETLYVRDDKGLLRAKPRRDIEAESWADIAFSSRRQTLELFQPRLKLTDPRPETMAGRNLVRYTLSLAAKPEEAGPIPQPLPKSLLPVPAPTRWRELARPLDLRGQVWLDSASGVLCKMQLEGRVEIADRQVRPTQLQVRYDAEVVDVGKVPSVKAPDSVPEFRRTDRPKDLLGFFSEYIEQEPAKEPKPGKSSSSTKAR
jgi:hypothetical protein